MNQDQLAILPAQMALKCISSGLRGTVPAVLGLTGLTVAGLVYGGVKGVSSTKKYIDKPKAGNNKGSKILNDVKGKVIKKTKDGKTVYEDGKVYAFELKNELYTKFEEQAKQLGVSFAATSDEKTTHLITDEQNKPIIDKLIKSLNKEIKASKETENQHIKDDIKIQDDTKAEDGVKNKEEELYKEVNFKDSLWNNIINFTMDKILNPLKNSGQVEIEEQENGKIIYFPKDKDKKLATSANNTSEYFKYVNLDSNKKQELYDEFTPYDKAVSIQQAKAKEKRLNIKEETLTMDKEKIPEVADMLKSILQIYRKEDIKNIKDIVKEINENLQKQGFKGDIVIDDQNNIKVNFDAKEKNSIIDFSQKMIKLNKGESKGLDIEETRKKAVKTEDKNKASNKNIAPNNPIR